MIKTLILKGCDNTIRTKEVMKREMTMVECQRGKERLEYEEKSEERKSKE